eukprot:TRINITY_DN346_c0_g1_i1.p1 TRINITY_DN346_c0_g1~~TRINITY_DN346_c0_g1_i1.p1  ORF type:complete len:692 (+),score=111.37 TRINITY_DN346_c0_g1_i1:749-2824(+)
MRAPPPTPVTSQNASFRGASEAGTGPGVQYAHGLASLACHKLWSLLDLNWNGELEYKHFVSFAMRVDKILSWEFDPAKSREEAYHKWFSILEGDHEGLSWEAFEDGMMTLARSWCGVEKEHGVYASFFEIITSHIVASNGMGITSLPSLATGAALHEVTLYVKHQRQIEYSRGVSTRVRDLLARLPDWRTHFYQKGIITVSDLARKSADALGLSANPDTLQELRDALRSYRLSLERGPEADSLRNKALYPPLRECQEDIAQVSLLTSEATWKSFLRKHGVSRVCQLAQLNCDDLSASHVKRLRTALTAFWLRSDPQLRLIPSKDLVSPSLMYNEESVDVLLDILPSQQVRDVFTQMKIQRDDDVDRLDLDLLQKLSRPAGMALRKVIESFFKSHKTSLLNPFAKLWRRLATAKPDTTTTATIQRELPAHFKLPPLQTVATSPKASRGLQPTSPLVAQQRFRINIRSCGTRDSPRGRAPHGASKLSVGAPRAPALLHVDQTVVMSHEHRALAPLKAQHPVDRQEDKKEEEDTTKSPHIERYITVTNEDGWTTTTPRGTTFNTPFTRDRPPVTTVRTRDGRELKRRSALPDELFEGRGNSKRLLPDIKRISSGQSSVYSSMTLRSRSSTSLSDIYERETGTARAPRARKGMLDTLDCSFGSIHRRSHSLESRDSILSGYEHSNHGQPGSEDSG